MLAIKSIRSAGKNMKVKESTGWDSTTKGEKVRKRAHTLLFKNSYGYPF